MKNKQNKGGFDSITGKGNLPVQEGKPVEVVSEKENSVVSETVKPAEKRKRGFNFLKFRKKRLFSLHGVLVILALLPFFLFGAASYAYQVHNNGRIFDGVKVFGIDAGGMTKEDLSKMLDRKIGSYKLTIQGQNQTFVASSQDLGAVYDKTQIINQAYDFGRDGSVLGNFLNRTEAFFSRYKINLGGKAYALKEDDIATPYKIDNEKLDQFLSGIESKIDVDPQDSQVTTQGSSMQIIPAVFGRKLETADLKNKILAELAGFQMTTIQLQTNVTSPAISDEKTKVLAEEADQITSKKVTLTYQDKAFSPSKSVLVSWVTFTKSGNQTNWQMVIDQSKMSDYINSIGNSINIYATDQKIRVENETKQIVTQAGKDGLVIDGSALENQVALELQSDPQVNVAIPMKVDHFKTDYDYVVVANWDKYIDVNLSTQHMDAYLKGGQRVGSWAITSGRDSLPTPQGSFLILRKAYDVCMPNPPSTQPLCGIHYVSYFTGSGDAIHEAWWRSYFGGQDYHWDGSHG